MINFAVGERERERGRERELASSLAINPSDFIDPIKVEKKIFRGSHIKL